MALYTVEGQTLVIYHFLRVCFSSLSCFTLDFLMGMLSVLYYTIFPSPHMFPPSSTIVLSLLSPPLHTETFHLLPFPPSHLSECQKIEVRWVKNRELFHWSWYNIPENGGKVLTIQSFPFSFLSPLESILYLFSSFTKGNRGGQWWGRRIFAVSARRAPQARREKGFPHFYWRITTLLAMSSILAQLHSTALDMSVISLALLPRIRS